MAKQDEIPTTNTVQPPPTTGMSNTALITWFRAIAGFCNGSQAVKQTDQGIRSLRTGNLIHIQGTVEIDATLLIVDILPVLPRENGFLTVFDSGGNVVGLPYTTTSKQVDFSTLGAGTYYITGQYIAEVNR